MASIAPVQTTLNPAVLQAAIALPGPGRLGRGGPVGVMIFNAGADGAIAELVARFFSEELDSLKWAEDYLLDSDIIFILNEAEEGIRSDESEEDEVYQKDILVNTSADAGWADGADSGGS